MKEHCFGIIPLQLKEGSWQVFLVQLKAGHWGFPKGHVEGEEEGHCTAERELYEETHLAVETFLPFDSLEEHYTYTKLGNKLEKTVTYYLAIVKGSVVLQEEEIVQGKWVLLADASNRITFDEAKNVCQQAQKILEP